MEPIKVVLDWERSTKRYHVYRDPSGTLVPDRHYVPIEWAGATPPITITITIEV